MLFGKYEQTLRYLLKKAEESLNNGSSSLREKLSFSKQEARLKRESDVLAEVQLMSQLGVKVRYVPSFLWASIHANF